MTIVKVNKAKIRRDIAADIAKKFIDSGKEYNCIACVFDFRTEALKAAKDLLDKGINLSKSEYNFAFVGNMADMFLIDAAKIVHSHYYG